MNGKPIKILKGVNGQLLIFEDRVEITRKGALSKFTQGFFKGDKTIYIHQITSIQVKKGGLTNGYIQFSLGGGNESTKGILDAVKDENTVMFSLHNNDLAAEIKQYIEKAMPLSKTPASISNIADEVRKLKILLDEGILTQEEFDKQKKRLLE
jgi:hypothetical protein